MSQPNQDLTFYKDHTLISDKILKSNNSYLTTITYIQGTSPNWLINSLIENSLQGSALPINQELKTTPSRSNVIFISFLHNKEFYIRNLKKNGIDLTQNSNFIFIDYFTNLFSEKIKDSTNAINDTNKLFDDSKIPKNSIIFIESPEILLYSTNIISDDLLFNLIKLNKKTNQLFIISSKDEELIDYNVNEIDNPTFKITDFLTKLLFRSQLNISLLPLKTGRAKDITGSLTITKGCLPYNDKNLIVNEKEYVYNITKDSNIKIYFR
ncbi:uncharacterized protein KGF55_001096 [Candida pseudojiufengensis]|uniref:uncharacterized protein n=1 Tax=Candida pseudojiufengensis TaxID=497109 RepID=UPI0022243753|nr:uncharacterized protein KGF55_001096 [Candida pseudojiufengensis]KAI5965733.1 hypothetical protein KGF55_001096 [Candida pseudojiufengensis]